MALLISKAVNSALATWDFQLNGNYYSFDTLLKFTALVAWKGKWTIATSYKVNDYIIIPEYGVIFKCLVAHTSGVGTFFTDWETTRTNWNPEPANNISTISVNTWTAFKESTELEGDTVDFLNIFEAGYNYQVNINISSRQLTAVKNDLAFKLGQGGVFTSLSSAGLNSYSTSVSTRTHEGHVATNQQIKIKDFFEPSATSPIDQTYGVSCILNVYNPADITQCCMGTFVTNASKNNTNPSTRSRGNFSYVVGTALTDLRFIHTIQSTGLAAGTNMRIKLHVRRSAF